MSPSVIAVMGRVLLETFKQNGGNDKYDGARAAPVIAVLANGLSRIASMTRMAAMTRSPQGGWGGPPPPRGGGGGPPPTQGGGGVPLPM